MAPRSWAPDPLAQAGEFTNEAEQARGGWRHVLLDAARIKLDDALAALRDSEEALLSQAAPIAALMRQRVEQRRHEIGQLADRIERLDAAGRA